MVTDRRMRASAHTCMSRALCSDHQVCSSVVKPSGVVPSPRLQPGRSANRPPLYPLVSHMHASAHTCMSHVLCSDHQVPPAAVKPSGVVPSPRLQPGRPANRPSLHPLLSPWLPPDRSRQPALPCRWLLERRHPAPILLG